MLRLEGVYAGYGRAPVLSDVSVEVGQGEGPWGTTYPANLRNLMQTWSEEQWLARARMPMRPPMPWFNLRDTTDADLRAMYRFMRSLGARGDPAPAYAAPGTAVNTPYISFVPQNLPGRQAAR